MCRDKKARLYAAWPLFLNTRTMLLVDVVGPLTPRHLLVALATRGALAVFGVYFSEPITCPSSSPPS